MRATDDRAIAIAQPESLAIQRRAMSKAITLLDSTRTAYRVQAEECST